jgi:hypothetical protein
MGQQNDILTNLALSDNLARDREASCAIKAFGYLPYIGPSMPEMKFACHIFEILIREYPGYHWVVECRQGMVSIWNETLSATFGWRKGVEIFDNDGKVAKMVGGAFLERFGLRASGMNDDKVLDLQKNARGDCKPIIGGEKGDEKT